ncbi:MAG TPA: DUF555 domain-containing protein [Methanospirillum sp.]|nr:DUF555 domain-containing protein [Methanospirillum sp.]
MTDYLVVLESAWVIKDVRSVDDAIGIAISEAGKRLNPTAKFVEIEAGVIGCPSCEEELPCALLIARTAMVGIRMEMRVFKADTSEHAGRIATSVIGKALRDIPLEIVDVQEL